MNIRFPDSIRWEIDLPDRVIQSYIPPATLQLLVENAIKHNKFSLENPLIILIYTDAESIIVENNLNIRTQLEYSLGLGLDNIRKRLELIAGKSILVEKTNSKFLVKIPLIADHTYEHFSI